MPLTSGLASSHSITWTQSTTYTKSRTLTPSLLPSRCDRNRVTGSPAAASGVLLRDDALHAALVIFVGTVDVEELQADPLRRPAVRRGQLRAHPAVEQQFAPAIGIERAQLREGGHRPSSSKPTRPAIGGGRGGVDETLALRAHQLPKPLREPEIGLDYQIGIGLGGGGDGAHVHDGVEGAAVAVKPGLQLLRRHDIAQVELRDVAPLRPRAAGRRGPRDVPGSTSAPARLEPIKPAPPVIRIMETGSPPTPAGQQNGHTR